MPGEMEDRSLDVRELILERVFPELRYGGDPDIERYFELRAAGRMLDALSIYRARLRPRYPDDARRVVLLKLYRTRSPAFPEFLRGLLSERADEIITRLRANIDALVAPLSGVSMRDTYAVLKAVERVARLLPDDADAARRTAEDMAEYARLLGHRKAEAERAAYLLGEFYDQASVDDDVPADFIASSLASEESRKRLEREEEEKKNFFDLSRIEFDEADVRRIEIPSGLERDEDIVLAYCHKYWLRVEDPAFERIVWLYSRKYGTKHYEVFKAIKTGRARKYQDDDILTMVGTVIATRYSYTVRGDLYMQVAWRRIKASMYGQTATRKTALRAARQAAARAYELSAESGPGEVEPDTVPASAEHQETAGPDRERRLVRAVAPAPLRRERIAKADFPATRSAGSISDRIKRLSGRAYDVYRDIFLSKVRGHIHAALARSRTKPGTAFREESNKAENLIYDFMEKNYSNAYMDWPSSEHRSRVRELGFEIDSLDGIIEACYRKIGA
ncbi:MAG: hypothetical protein CVV47_16780 [Spirochaetae bacterium HGW-Spirochaetae-3]|nr:MAG: hypothetical protein CVV47_16780 [Spirochaetae bacterium HGW-Spirochaetae-3]